MGYLCETVTRGRAYGTPHARTSRPKSRPRFPSAGRSAYGNPCSTFAAALLGSRGVRRSSATDGGRPGGPARASAMLCRVEYVSRVPRPPLDGLIDDLYDLK